MESSLPHVVYVDGQPHLPHNVIVADADQHRKRFPQEYLRELSQSIKENGLQQPVKVRYDGNSYQLIDGECRWRSIGMISKTFLTPVVIDTKSDKETGFRMGVVANFQRLTPDPIDEANAYAKILKDNKRRRWDTAKVAESIGKTKAHVEYYLALLELHPMLQGMVSRAPKDGQLAVGQAYQIVCASRNAEKKADTQFDIIKAYQKGVPLQDAIRAVRAEIAVAQQGSLLTMAEYAPSPEAKKQRGKLEKLVEKADKLCSDTWDQERAALAVSAYRQNEIDLMAEKLECVEKYLKFIRKNIQAESARRKMATSKKRSVAATKAAKKRK